jgi:hypothetical protein
MYVLEQAEMTEDRRQHSGEKEHHWQKIEIVQLGEEFLLFDTTRERSQVRYSDNGAFAGMRSSICLETGFLGRLPISISAAPYAKARYAVITPFDREQGYPIDKEDLSLPSRMAKISRMKRELAEAIEGLYLFVFVANEDMLLNALLHTLSSGNATAPESAHASMLRYLFLTLKFPRGSSFTARASFNLQRPLLRFGPFFPSDTGPLPGKMSTTLAPPQTASERGASHIGNAKHGEDIREGYDILLPFDQAKLQMIRARFLFLPNPDD